MYRICTTEKSAAQQQKYEECLLELMLVTPYQEITVGDICSQMGTTRKSFYYYFPNKQECLHALIDHTYYAAHSIPLPEDMELRGYPQRLLSCLLYLKKEQQWLDILLRNHLFEVFAGRVAASGMKEAGYPQKKREPGDRDHELEAILYHLHGVLAVIRLWHDTGYQRSIYEVAEAIHSFMPQAMIERI